MERSSTHTRHTPGQGSTYLFLCIFGQSTWPGLGGLQQSTWYVLCHIPCQRQTLHASAHWEAYLREATARGTAVKLPSNILFQSYNCPLEPFFSRVALALCYIEIAAKLTLLCWGKKCVVLHGKKLWQVQYFIKLVISLYRGSSVFLLWSWECGQCVMASSARIYSLLPDDNKMV